MPTNSISLEVLTVRGQGPSDWEYDARRQEREGDLECAITGKVRSIGEKAPLKGRRKEGSGGGGKKKLTRKGEKKDREREEESTLSSETIGLFTYL
ncbi:hypothetical protein Tco_0188946 [Tanacetum coccineum]